MTERKAGEAQDWSDRDLFRVAWAEFTETAAATVAPEGSYQAWLAHFAIGQFGILRVVGEVDFGTRYFGDHRTFFTGHSVRVDVLVLREEKVRGGKVYLPRRSWLAPRSAEFDETSPRSGLARLQDFSVIAELKVSSTQGEGLDYQEVVQDFRKLDAILARAEELFPEQPPPAAFVGVYDNHPSKRLNFDLLRTKVEKAGVRSDVQLLAWSP